MRTQFSSRRARFSRLVHEAYYQPTERLLEQIKIGAGRAEFLLARLACLRILVGREVGIAKPSGLPYPQRKKAVRLALGI